MDKICVLDENKKCTNCGECDKCDLNPDKICDNCGRCLNPDNAKTRSILIDNIIDDENPVNAEAILEEEILNDYDDNYVEDGEHKEIEIEFIEDVDGLNEILNNEDKRKKFINETSPGLFTLKKDRLNK
ncbi:Zn-finger domain-containing protein [Clostridium acetobutylicum]|nr:Zn-finger domain-containing protein [Clostridium acetobutylicum]